MPAITVQAPLSTDDNRQVAFAISSRDNRNGGGLDIPSCYEVSSFVKQAVSTETLDSEEEDSF